MCLLAAPYTAEGPYLMPTILTARMLLLIPFFLPSMPGLLKEGSSADSKVLFDQPQAQAAIAVFTAAMTTKQLFFTFMEGFKVTEIVMALISHPAVTSLGFDFLVTAMSFAIWVFIRDSERQKAA